MRRIFSFIMTSQQKYVADSTCLCVCVCVCVCVCLYVYMCVCVCLFYSMNKKMLCLSMWPTLINFFCFSEMQEVHKGLWMFSFFFDCAGLVGQAR